MKYNSIIFSCFFFRLSARYFDPVTQLPYATLQAFRVLREAYYQQLEDKGDASQPGVGEWLAWRRQYKKARATAQNIRPVQPPQQPTQTNLVGLTPTPQQQNQTPTVAATSVSAVAQILRTAGHTPGASTLLGTGNVNGTPTQATRTMGSTVQLVQAVGPPRVGAARSGGSQMVVVTSAGPGGGLHLVGSPGTGTTNLLVQGGTTGGATTNLLVQGVHQGATTGGGSVQIVQATGGAGVSVGGTGGTSGVHVVQSGRITLRPVASQAFTNLQSLLK